MFTFSLEDLKQMIWYEISNIPSEDLFWQSKMIFLLNLN